MDLWYRVTLGTHILIYYCANSREGVYFAGAKIILAHKKLYELSVFTEVYTFKIVKTLKFLANTQQMMDGSVR